MDLDELLDRAHGETEIETVRRDGTHAFIPIWMVRVGDALYARAYRGPQTGWYRLAIDGGETRIRLDGVDHRMVTTAAPGEERAAIDAAYWDTFTGEEAAYVPSVVSDAATERTVRLEFAD